jgi:uncharacterized protein YjbI with pentapeptide repeats
MIDAITAEPRPVQRFRYWDYPEPGPVALAMLAPSPLRDQLQALLQDGDAGMIEEWLDTAVVAAEIKKVLRQGLRGEKVYDAVEAASLRWDDRTGTRTACVVRRQGRGLVYEVWQDGMQLAEREANRELGGRELLKLMLSGDFETDADLPEVAAFEATSDFHEDLPDEAEVELWRCLAVGVIEGWDLPGRDFAGADLAGIRASRANLEAAGFYGARLVGADFFATELRHANLCGAELRYAFLQSADLEGAQLQGADLRNANLRFACLRNAKLCGADLRHADLRHADTRGADFAGAILDDCRR